MRLATLLTPTLREDPADAELASHRLMVRAGLLRKVAAGVYTHLPLGLTVLRRIEAIIREEMNARGGQELLLPIVQPAEIWRETGRWAEYGPEMWKLRDRHEREFCLGPTHEELITDLVRVEVSSYRQLPLLLYQIANKYRDEIRPRFGVMRAREFIMKDLYSFDRDAAGMRRSYQAMYDAYASVFARCGLRCRVVEADPGAIGGSGTHEFMALAAHGEAEIVTCDGCDYAANVETAAAQVSALEPAGDAEPEPFATPGVRTIAELAAFTGLAPERLSKLLFCWAVDETGARLVGVVLRGDRELNEVKLKNELGCLHLRVAAPDEVQEHAGVPVGYAGPHGLDELEVLVDREVMQLGETVTGANREGYHLQHVVPRRDFATLKVADLGMVRAGDRCPHCGGSFAAHRGIEVGQIFQLWQEYSRKLGATFHAEDGEERACYMGCYGIGVTRTMAAIIEQHHDDDGIIWPVAVAPAEAVVLPVHSDQAEQREAADNLYRALLAAGVRAVVDDREERPGVKFHDADLIGFPLRLTVGPRSLAREAVELRVRRTGEEAELPLADAPRMVAERLQALAAAEREAAGP